MKKCKTCYLWHMTDGMTSLDMKKIAAIKSWSLGFQVILLQQQFAHSSDHKHYSISIKEKTFEGMNPSKAFLDAFLNKDTFNVNI